jgi:hypothetical protein
MKSNADLVKETLSASIGPFEKSDFKARLQVYDLARRALGRFKSGEDARNTVEGAIRETENEIVALSKLQIDRLAARATLISRVSASLIGLTFVAVQFWNLSFLEALLNIPPDILFQATLTLYFLVIGFGITFDIETQKQIYILDPNHGRIERNSIFAIIAYVLTAAILFAFSRNYVLFAIALTIFHFSGVAFWRVLSHQMMPRIIESEDSASLRGDHFALERLCLVREYMSGSWHFPRHAILSVIVLVFDFVAIPNSGEAYLISLLTKRWPAATTLDLESHLPSVVFGCFALTGEGWTMAKRFETRIRLNVIDKLQRRYNLKMRAVSDFSDSDTVIPIIS